MYNDIFVDVLLRGWDSERKLSRRLPNTSTFVPNDRSQCLYCVLPIMRCAFEAHLDVGLAERQTPCRFVGNVHISFTYFREDGRFCTFPCAQGTRLLKISFKSCPSDPHSEECDTNFYHVCSYSSK